MPRTPSYISLLLSVSGGAARALNSLGNEEMAASSNVGDGKTTREETLEKRRVERRHQK